MREVLRGERHHDRPQPQRYRRGCAVTGFDPVRDPAHEQQQQDCGHHRAEQRQGPDHRRPGLDPVPRPVRAPRAVPELRVGRRGAGGQRPARVLGVASVDRRVTGDPLCPDRVQPEVGGKCERRQAGCLDRVEVAVDPGLVLGLPVPPIDLAPTVRERAHLSVEGRLRPSHRVHQQPPRDAQRHDRCDARAAASPPPGHPPYAAHGIRSVEGLKFFPSKERALEALRLHQYAGLTAASAHWRNSLVLVDSE